MKPNNNPTSIKVTALIAIKNQRIPVCSGDAGPELVHFAALALDQLSDEPFDAPIERILLALLQPHRIFDFTVPNQVCNIGHGGQRFSLGDADPLNQLHLFWLSGLLKTSQCIVETVVLAKDVFDRRLASQEQSHGREVHLHGQGVLDILRPVHSFVSFIQELALTGHF